MDIDGLPNGESCPVDEPPLTAKEGKAMSGRATGAKRAASAVEPGARASKRPKTAAVPPAVSAAKSKRGTQAKARPKAQLAANPAGHTTLSVTAPDSAPAWFTTAMGMLQSKSLGPAWMALVSAWATFEAKENYQQQGKLLTTRRPTAVADWIQRHRSPTWLPKVDVASFEEDFSEWWKALQPGWRHADDGQLIRGAGDWAETNLRRPGLNGVLSILAALFFWGVEVAKGADARAWSHAVDDVAWVMGHL
ncbi:hypothetical protein Hypma_009711 [Hypsizygus marmoreus]|uniref:Uncharacterized protein n=1 Tax=Hypsizygus marmoreus TaxID=39966 RepID=A0A369JWQ2_HYPMA|nr:hypothetical protein Hypma_009711 [Hypsizygus marmoreus]